jgi:Mg2+ and Co2+ transporter CorA
MNTGVPGGGGIEGFYVVIVVMIVVLGTMITWFRRRGWL